MPAFRIGERVDNAVRPSLDGQDAFDGIERMGAEADGPFQSGQPVDAGIRAQQRQYFDRLTFALTLIAQKTVEEALGDGSEFGKAFAQ